MQETADTDVVAAEGTVVPVAEGTVETASTPEAPPDPEAAKIEIAERFTNSPTWIAGTLERLATEAEAITELVDSIDVVLSPYFDDCTEFERTVTCVSRLVETIGRRLKALQGDIRTQEHRVMKLADSSEQEDVDEDQEDGVAEEGTIAKEAREEAEANERWAEGLERQADVIRVKELGDPAKNSRRLFSILVTHEHEGCSEDPCMMNEDLILSESEAVKLTGGILNILAHFKGQLLSQPGCVSYPQVTPEEAHDVTSQQTA